MSDLPLILLVLHLPALIICGCFYLAGRLARRPRVGLWLRRSAVVWAVVLLVVYTFVVVVFATCNGDMLYGYSQCRVVPNGFADTSLPALLLVTATGVVYGAILAVVTLVLEWRGRRARTP